jgi:geranylgeranyl transferase type-2 subunit beta
VKPDAHYLERLMIDLARGMPSAGVEFRERHGRWLLRQMLPSGAFADREGEEDLYYTAFGLRGLAVLGYLEGAIAERASNWLRSRRETHASAVDLHAFLQGRALVVSVGGPDPLDGITPGWEDRVADYLRSVRAPDGGHGKTPNPTTGSTYHTFLALLCHQMIGRPPDDAGALMAFLDSRRRDDGGYVEVKAMRRSGANPTAAGVGLEQMLRGGLRPEALERTASFLSGLSGFDGGFRANGLIPVSDLLSSFTVAWTLSRMGMGNRLDRPALRRFLESAEDPAGGFGAAAWDAGRDSEYTFYGLGLAALAHSPEA